MCKRKRKKIIKVFKDYGLSIIIETNIQIANFLDTTFNLMNNINKPYRKPNDEPLYIKKYSNHPPSIPRQLPKSTRSATALEPRHLKVKE